MEELRSFIGYCNFLRQYVENFASVMRPLYLITSAKRDSEWSDDCAKAFSKIKYLIGNAPTLFHPNRNKKFIIIINSNQYAIWASLLQRQSDDGNDDNINGSLKVIYYCSRLLNGTELRYNETKKEMLALKHALNEWRHIFLGMKHFILIYTQNKDLASLIRNLPNESDFLNEYNFYLFYHSNDTNSLIYSNDNTPSKKVFLGSMRFIPSDKGKKKGDIKNLNNSKETYDADKTSNDSSDSDIVSDDEEIELAIEDITLKDIRYQYKSDMYAQKVMDDLKYDTNETGYSYNWILSGGLLVRKYNQNQIYISPQLQRTVIQKTYNENKHNPLSCNKFYEVISSNYWWPGMKQDIKDYYARRMEYQQLKIHKYSVIPWKVGCFYYDFFRDETTKMARFVGFNTYPNPSLTSQAFMDNVYRLYGHPAHIIIDSPITSQQWKSILKICSCTCSNPNKNDKLNKERCYVTSYLGMIMKNKNTPQWKWYLAIAEACYNQYGHPSTKKSPNQALYQYQCNYDHGKRKRIHHFSTLDKRNKIWEDFKRILEICKNKIY
ncbi:hypothetical protein PIROE2DRAFT_63830 [Piromyces sp. E2]|nr:hypothetical protein PIROE2DRAFT_63830 [Piromyces sp. E2]|eukprot:OUM59345.1 hypothetical protein PIROE2DRAFT_63830 [Piromyces sp. E2]